MTFILAQDACEAWFRSHRRLRPRVSQNLGQLHLSALTVMPMERWLLRFSTSASVMAGYNAFMSLITIVDVSEPIAHRAVMLPLPGPRPAAPAPTRRSPVPAAAP